MHCVVTGAAGFVGSSLCDRLLADGHTVTGIDCFVDYYSRSIKEKNLSGAKGHGSFSFIEEDLNRVDMDRLLEGADLVFHQAGQAGVRASWGGLFESYCAHNILATQRILEAAKGRPSLRRIVYASSSSIYGDAETFPTSERVVPRPVSPYGVTKLAAEHLATLYAVNFGVPTVSLRYFTVFGPRQRPDMAFHRFAKGALMGTPLTLYGDGLQSRDFTFIDDIVEANMLAATRGQNGAVYNIGGGTQATVNDVLEIVREIAGPITVERSERQSGDARHTSADTSAAKAALGFSPKVTLREGIEREIEWMETALKEGIVS